MSKRLDRREALCVGGLLSLTLPNWADAEIDGKKLSQSVCRWCYGRIPLPKLAEAAKSAGYASIELLNPPQVGEIKPFGLTCAVLNGGPSISITNCLNRTENHDRIEKDLKAAIDFAAAEKIPNVICFSGNRKGMPDDVGLRNCAMGLKRVVGNAEQRGVTVIMEMLNSKKDHKDYMGDRTQWGVDLCKLVDSPRFRLLYDIYHMQIMEGDVIATIQKHHEFIAHYHTGGVPGRAEIDDTQELNYPAIVRAIQKTGYTGFIGQEFIPKRDALVSMAEGFKICDV